MFERDLKRIFGALADEIEAKAVEKIDAMHAVATGKLRSAIHTRLEVEGTQYTIVCYAEGEMAPYAGYVHQGREPGKMPPIGPLMMWAKKKMGAGGNPLFSSIGKGMVNRTRFRVLKSGRISINQSDLASQKAAARIAWGVAMKIKKEGIEPRPYFLEAVREVLARW